MHLYTIPSNHAFVDALASGIQSRFGAAVERYNDMLLLLPNRRSVNALKEAFLRQGGGKAALLPQMMPLGDMDEEEINFSLLAEGDMLDVPPPMASLRQQLILAKLTHQWRKQKYGDESMFVHSLKLAGELARFLSEVEREQLCFENLEQLYPEEYQAHWQDTLEFLKILMEHWPQMLQEQGAITMAQYRNQMLALQAQIWQENPPEYPVIAAGAVGTVPAVSELLSVVASMPNGYVVLPGLDQQMDEASWGAIGETHPQYEIKQFLERLNIEPSKVEIWHEKSSFKTTPTARLELASQLMLPAESVESWRQYTPSQEAFEDVYKLEAASLHEEAGMIALMLRETLEIQGKTAALVTHDRSLARHVVMALKRWHIQVDDSAGKPLAESTPAVFIRLVASLLEKDANWYSILACLKHPYAAVGYAPLECLNLVRQLEHGYLRGVCRAKTPQELLEIIHVNGEDDALVTFLEHVCARTAPLYALLKQKDTSLIGLLDKVIKVAELLAESDSQTGQQRLWQSDAAEQLQEWYQQLHHVNDLPQFVHASEIENVLEALLEGHVFRPRYGLHPRLHILGPLEARLQQYDRLILGGLNEGSWPSLPAVDPWMSRPMRVQFGLALPERRIGQSAHDFMQYFCAKEVILTRSRKIDGAEATPSRWWMRLNAVLKASGNEEALIPKTSWYDWYQSLYTVDDAMPITSPQPKPPLRLRPRELSVTNIKYLQQNPYALYAKKILRLYKLDEIDKMPGVLEFGNFIHTVVERFSKHSWEDGDAAEFLVSHWLTLAEDVFHAQYLPDHIKPVWWPRVERIAAELIALEMQRRMEIKALYSEVKGKWKFNGKAGDFTLTAKADRLEIDHENGLHVIDYKTGSPPTAMQIASGEASQLPLEALIALRGGFDTLKEAPKSLKELAYWKISGRKEALKPIPFPNKTCPMEVVDTWIEEAEKGLKELVEWFDDSSHAYLAYPFGSDKIIFDDYEHLIREEEWES